MIQVVPGSERWYCRIEGCNEFTVGNLKYGFCLSHYWRWREGETLPVKYGFIPLEHMQNPQIAQAYIEKVEVGNTVVNVSLELQRLNEQLVALQRKFTAGTIALLRESKRIHHDRCAARAVNGYRVCDCGSSIWNARVDEILAAWRKEEAVINNVVVVSSNG